VVFSALYLISNLMELGQGGFSTPQLLVTYAGVRDLAFAAMGAVLLARAGLAVTARRAGVAGR
jgi:hypothetical protein